jgi:hypothetical protein
MVSQARGQMRQHGIRGGVALGPGGMPFQSASSPGRITSLKAAETRGGLTLLGSICRNTFAWNTGNLFLVLRA